MSASEKKEREESNHPVFIVKLRNSELIKESAASFMIHARGNPAPEIKIFKVTFEALVSYTFFDAGATLQPTFSLTPKLTLR